MEIGDLVINIECMHWGVGLIIDHGPVFPVSGKQFVVKWPEVPKSHYTEGDQPAGTNLDYCPKSFLAPANNETLRLLNISRSDLKIKEDILTC
jgi:hypothetical protein